MVFLTSIDILDTGFLSKTTRTSQLSTSDRVNSGNALRLKGVDFEIGSSSNLDKETSPGKKTGPEINYVSANPREFTLTLYINSKNTDTNNVWGVNDMSLLAEILRIPETEGWKALYYPVSADYTANDRNKEEQMIYTLGSRDTTEAQGDISISIWTGAGESSGQNLTDVKYLSAMFETCSMRQEGNSSTIRITLNGVLTT